MGNINDAYDPTYSADPNYAWDAATGQWYPVSQGIPQGQRAPPSQSTATVGGKPAPGTSGAGQTAGSGSGITDNGRFGINMGVTSTGAEGANWMGQLQGMQAQLGKRPAAQLDQSQSNQMRGAQTNLVTDLQNQAAGIGPSLAQAQLQKASDQNLANTMASIQSTRGMGATAAAGQAQGAGAQAGQQLAQDSAILRLQEQMQAKGMLGQLATGARGQDIGAAAQNAQLQAQNEQQIAALSAQMIGMGMSKVEADRQARIQVAGMNQQAGVQQATLDQNQSQFNRTQGAKEAQATATFFMDLLKSIMGGAGGAAGAGAVTGG